MIMRAAQPTAKEKQTMHSVRRFFAIAVALASLGLAVALPVSAASAATTAHVVASAHPATGLCEYEYTPVVDQPDNSAYIYWNCNDAPVQVLQARAWCHPATGTNYFVYGAKVSDVGVDSSVACTTGDVIKGLAVRIEIGGVWNPWGNLWSA
jgi:hypothetical protein